MSSAGGMGRARARLRALPDRTPLRVKMITAVLALVLIALVVISLTSRAVFRDYLQRQANTQLSNYYNQVESSANSWLSGGSHGRLALIANDGLDRLWLLDSHGQQISLPSLGPGSNGQEIGTPGPPPQVPASQAWLTQNAGKPATVPGQSGETWLVIAQQIQNVQVFDAATNQVTTQDVTLVVGTNEGNVDQSISALTEIDLLVSGAVLLILAIVGVAVVRASLRPLTDIEQTAAAIAAGDLSSRVPDRDPRTEVGRLGRSLNTMLAQIETAFQDRTRSEEAARRSERRMRQFLADASHELRTPLTAIRGFAEYYRQRGGVGEIPGASSRAALGGGGATALGAVPGEPGTAVASRGAYADPDRTGPLPRADLDRIMQRVEQESSRMGVLVEDMLLLARLDQQRPLDLGPVDMLTLAADAVHDARVVAPGRNISLSVGSGAALLVVGDEIRLRQVIGNLMSNALNHTPDRTPIEVRVRLGSLDEWRAAASAASASRSAFAVSKSDVRPFPAVVLEVADRGSGLTPDQAEHVFERFYRGDQARTRKSGGTGLGLAIVAALVAAHDGAVWVESPPGYGGAIFRIALPLAPEARYTEPEFDDEPADVLDYQRRPLTAGRGSARNARRHSPAHSAPSTPSAPSAPPAPSVPSPSPAPASSPGARPPWTPQPGPPPPPTWPRG